MFLEHKPSGKLVEIMTLRELWDPCTEKVMGRFHAGQEMQQTEPFTKAHLHFPSGEELPKCWVDVNYREHQDAQKAS